MRFAVFCACLVAAIEAVRRATGLVEPDILSGRFRALWWFVAAGFLSAGLIALFNGVP